jgi:hypothetical protein
MWRTRDAISGSHRVLRQFISRRVTARRRGLAFSRAQFAIDVTIRDTRTSCNSEE